MATAKAKARERRKRAATAKQLFEWYRHGLVDINEMMKFLFFGDTPSYGIGLIEPILYPTK